MDHSITINGTKNTWKDWHLIPCEMPVVAPPTERMILVTVAGRCGTVDLSHSLTGNPVFENREGSWDFYVENESWQNSNETNYDIVVRTSGHYAAEQIAQWLGLNAGQFQTVVLEDDPNFTYTGRVWVDEKIQWKNGHTVLTLNYSLYPYATVRWNDLWKWDDFCFERDIAWYRQAELKNRALAAGEVLTLQLPPSDVRYPITVRTESGSSVEVVFLKSLRYDSYATSSSPDIRSETKTWTLGSNIFLPVSETIGVEYDPGYTYWELKVTAKSASTVTVTIGNPQFL